GRSTRSCRSCGVGSNQCEAFALAETRAAVLVVSMSAPTSAASPAAEITSRRSRRLASPLPLARLLPPVRPYRWRPRLAAICLLLAASVGLAFPQVVRHLLDAAFQQHDRGLLDRIALALIALFALQGVMNFVQVYLLTSTTERVIARLREDVFTHLVRLSPG